MALYTHHELDEIQSGVFQHTQHMRPIAYNDNGTIRRITNSLGNSGDPNLTIGVNELIQFRVRDRLSGNSPVLFFGKGQDHVRVTPLDTNNADAVVNENIVSYPDAWNNADLKLTIAGHRVQKDIVLRTNHPTVFSFRIDDHNGLDLDTLSSDSFKILNPMLTKLGELPINLQWAKSVQGGKTILSTTLPQGDFTGWSLDPTITLQPDATAGVDTYLNARFPTLNSGTADILVVGDRVGVDEAIRTAIKFDLTSLPANAVISSATLSLYATTDESNNARTFRVFRLKRAWVEAQATWNIYSTGNNWSTAGAFHADDCEQTDIGTRAFTATETLNAFKDFALTPTRKTALDLGNGWLIKADAETDDAYHFSSSDAATAANRPTLVIVYTLPDGSVGQLTRAKQFSIWRQSWRIPYLGK